MDTLIIQDTFEPYYAGRDGDSKPEKAAPPKRWLVSRGPEAKAEDKAARKDSRAGA
jgi:hypothetical protein